jgi:bifunctional non-homologous end joining protein LigD
VRDKGLEGIVAKRLDSTYREGHRGPSWLKLKVRCQQEFVVVGYKPGDGKFKGTMGALLLAVYDQLAGGFKLCGAAGTGFKEAQRYEIQAVLDEIADPDAEQDVAMTAAERRELAREGAVWVTPQVVAQVEFQRWTEDDRLWHPSFQGFRDDKEPRDVVREPCAGTA